jgi:hypothetical protein
MRDDKRRIVMKTNEELKTTRANIDIDWNLVLVALCTYWATLDGTTPVSAALKEEIFEEIKSLSRQVGLNI